MYVTLSTDQTVFRPSLALPAPRPSKQCGSVHRALAAGSNLYLEGDPSEHLYEVISGVLRLARVLENGRRQVIAFGLPGDIVGFPKGSVHHTDCDVLQSCDVIAHPRRALEIGSGDPELHQRLLQAALREIAGMQDHFLMLARKSAMEKLASFLIVMSQRTGVPIGNYSGFSLSMSRADIADFLGLTIETVSRMFSRLRSERVIALRTAQTVLVLDMEALIAASESED